MDVQIRPGISAEADLVARVDTMLSAGETVRDGHEVRVGLADDLGLDGLRGAAAAVARAARREGGRLAWRAGGADDVRALVEGTSFGVYDPGLRKSGYGERPGLTLLLDAEESLRPLAERQAVVARGSPAPATSRTCRRTSSRRWRWPSTPGASISPTSVRSRSAASRSSSWAGARSPHCARRTGRRSR
jgi:hypothetical protein